MCLLQEHKPSFHILVMSLPWMVTMLWLIIKILTVKINGIFTSWTILLSSNYNFTLFFHVSPNHVTLQGSWICEITHEYSPNWLHSLHRKSSVVETVLPNLGHNYLSYRHVALPWTATDTNVLILQVSDRKFTEIYLPQVNCPFQCHCVPHTSF